MSKLDSVRVLFFDVFGTCVDWRTSVTNALHMAAKEALSDGHVDEGVKQKATSMTRQDWEDFAQEWRNTYLQFTRTCAEEQAATFKTVDEHHLDSLRELLAGRGLISLADSKTDVAPGSLFDDRQIQQLSKAWHNLQPWKDTNPGVEAFNKRLVTSTLTNGNTALITDIAKNGGIPFQHLLNAESLGAYKPSSAAYLRAAKQLNLEPTQCALVAAHLRDLAAARKCGFKTIYVERPLEDKASDPPMPFEELDIWVKAGESGFLTVAKHLGL